MDQETWRFVNTFAPWASALETFSAVAVALYLARRSDRIQLESRCGLRKVALITYISSLLRPAPPAPDKEFVWLGITNIGRRSATIAHIYWKPVPSRKRDVVWFPPQNDYSSKFPIMLEDGESANYSSPVPEFQKNFTKYFREEFSGFAGAIRLRSLRVCVGTSTGDVFRCKPEKELRALVRKMATDNADAF